MLPTTAAAAAAAAVFSLSLMACFCPLLQVRPGPSRSFQIEPLGFLVRDFYRPDYLSPNRQHKGTEVRGCPACYKSLTISSFENTFEGPFLPFYLIVLIRTEL